MASIPSVPQKQLKFSDRPNSARTAITSETNQSSLKTIKESNGLDEQVRDFKNLRSQLHQWIYSQSELEMAFDKQKEQASAEIFERYLQVKELKEQNCEMRNLIQNTQKLTVLDATLTI